jgi:hypothetical protein
VRAAVQDVHHGRRKGVGARSPQVAIEGESVFGGGGAGYGHGDGQDRVRTQPAFVFGAVEFDHAGVDRALVGGIEVRKGFRDFGVHILDRIQDTLAQIAITIAIAQFNRFMFAGGSAARNDGPSGLTSGQQDFRLYSRIAARVEHLAGLDFADILDSDPLDDVWIYC